MSVAGRDDVLYESLEIRVLGPLRVRRADGTVVQPAEWLTSQTADLLRLLALRVNEPVGVDVLTEALWPKVDETRGRASLRNAASRLRKVLGEDCVQRRLGGLVLTGAWVDVHAFRTLAHQARREMLAGAWSRVVTTTREAEAVYLGEFRAHNDGAEWAFRERDALSGDLPGPRGGRRRGGRGSSGGGTTPSTSPSARCSSSRVPSVPSGCSCARSAGSARRRSR